MSIPRFLLVLLFVVAPLRAQFIISEFLASNSNSITDESGNNEDWIEIYNSGPSAANLLGWYLTDDVNQPRKWAFPNKTLSSGTYLVVFASNKNRTNPGANLHTNFKLSGSGEYLALTKDIAGGGVQVVQAFNPYPPQATDVAYGSQVTLTNTALVAAGAAAKTLIPTAGNGGSVLGDLWKGALANEPFNDAAWTAGTTAAGFTNAGVATTNLKLRLNANDNTNLMADTSGASHPGTNNTASWVPETTDANGRTRHGALQFNATDSNGTATGDQVVVAAHTDFNASAGTIMFWIKTAGNVADGGNVEGATLFDRRVGTSAGQGLVVYLTDAGNVRIQPETNAGVPVNTFSSTSAVNDDAWHHVALVFRTTSGQACALYLDGVAAGTGNNSAAWSFSTSQQIEIGRSHDPFWRRFNGQFDDYRFYNTALTQTQIQTIFNNEDEPVTPGTNVLAAMQNVNPSAFVRVPFNVANPAAFTGMILTMKWNDGYAAWLNGTPIASFAAPASPAWNATATQSHSAGAPLVTSIANPAALLRAGTNILAIQGLNNTAANGVFSVLPQLDGSNSAVGVAGYLTAPTPGAANSTAKTNIGPFVSNVTKNPNPRPTGTAASPPLTIIATVVPSLRPLAAGNPVQLKYAVMYNAEVSVDMTLTGAPNVYTANIPTNTLGAGQMLRWRVVATDNTAIAGTAPEYSDALDNEQYYGTVAEDSSIETSLPVLYWFASSSTAADNATGTRNSFFFKARGETGVGRFYDNVEINLHGQSSSGFTKKSYDLDFNEDNRFDWDVTQQRVKDVNLLTNWGDKSKTHNAMTHEAFATVGSAAHWDYQVRVQQVTPDNAANPANHFWSIADLLEDGDDVWMDRIGRDPDGALYKIYDSLASSGSAEKKTRKYEGKTDLDAFISALNVSNTLAARRQYAYDNMDLPQCISYFVGCALVSHQDHGHKNYYVYRDTLGTREWMIFPWDVDLTWGRDWLDASGYFTDTMFTNNDLDLYNSAQQSKGENRLYSLIVGNSDIARLPATEFRNMVLRRLRTVLDGYLGANGVLENRFAQFSDLFDPPAIGTSDADRDFTKWGSWGNAGGATGGAAVRYHIDQIRTVYLPGRRTFLATATLAGAGLPVAQPANAADLITLETVDFNPATGNQAHEFFVVRNANAYAVDISGWKITGAVDWTFKSGTVLPSGGGVTENLGDLYVAKDPYLFRQRATVPDDGLPAASQYRYVQGPYNGQLSARGETIELRDAAGILLKTKTWTPAPTAMQNALRITELNYAPAVPSIAESAALPGVVESDFEFIELMNIGATPLPLTGAHFDQGVTFTFPAFTLAAGARCLVVANVAAFQLRYGHAFDAQIAGAYVGNLDNNGEAIQLLDNVGENVLDFSYNNAWFPPTDEGGRSLVIRNANPDWQTCDLPTSWAISGNPNGSPGAADADFANVYEGWRYDHFTKLEFPTVANPSAPAALTVDPDGDLLTNLAEYAFGRAPRVADSTGLASTTLVDVAGTKYGAIIFNRRHKALDLTYTVETTSDLATWTPVDLPVGTATDLGNGIERVTYRDDQAAGAGKRFLRVRAVK